MNGQKLFFLNHLRCCIVYGLLVLILILFDNCLLGSTGHGETGLDKYLSSSRNLMKHKAAGQRLRRLIQGRAEVAKFLCFELPKTRHDLDSFSLDVPLATPAMVCVTLTGVFVERTSLATASSAISPNGVRHFARTFNLVPAGSGVVIVNETLHVTVATKFQSKVLSTCAQSLAKSKGFD